MDQLAQWSTSNRGAFVLCALVRHLDRDCHAHNSLVDKLREMLSSMDESDMLKGQQALLNELGKLNRDKKIT